MNIEYSLVYSTENECISKLYTGTITQNNTTECFLLEISFIKNKGTEYMFVTQNKHNKKEENMLRAFVISNIRD